MEKFSTWRDAGTGIQPFLPPVPSRKDSDNVTKIATAIGYVLKPVIGILKLSLVLVTSLLLFLLVDVICLVLKPIKPVHRIIHYLFSAILTRLILFFMGFYWIRSEIVSSLTKGRGIPKARERTNKRGGVDAGDIIVCNWVSYVEIFYLTFRFDPIFTQYYPATNTLRPISLWKAIWTTGSYPNLDPPIETETFTLQELINYAKAKRSRPIVIFPEGTTSNGRALLKFNPIFKNVSIPVNDFKIHIFTVRYDFENFSPTYTVGNKFWHFIRLCSQFINTLQIRSLISDESSFSRYFAPTAQPSIPATTPDDIVGSQVLNYMLQVGRFRKTGLGLVEKKEFLNFYREKASGGYTKKNR
ncbi:3270_t:CDS:2 [Funneliformis mosseae]|uniref:3270_t:CDS:1 n=1 Tax=Funneliformis mosseae TaxID=27381 RepID=A0A9N9AWE6_FUNMO|nr:3270_t:CDS:2 [Funneliformis mosseae]